LLIIKLFPCRWYEWGGEKSEQAHKLGLKFSDKVLTQLEDVGQQLVLAFNNEGSALAAGGEVETVFPHLFLNELLSLEREREDISRSLSFSFQFFIREMVTC
jgi:hypothetical protein